MIQKRTIGIIGTGKVGMAAAYALFLNQSAGRIILVDQDIRRAEGEAMDMMHGQPYVGHVSVQKGDYPDLTDAQVVVVCAGVSQKPGESRLDLLNRNADVMKQIARHLDSHAPDAVLIVASNPVDILTFSLQQLSQRPENRVIGTGTMLDTGRFRALLGQHYNVDPRSVHAYIIGEHGDSEVPLWSSAHIGGASIIHNKILGRRFKAGQMQQLFDQVKNAAYEIIDRKGYTNWAIGVVIARLCSAVLSDQKSVFTVSMRLSGEYDLAGLCLSIPGVVGLAGVEARLLPYLSGEEQEGLYASAKTLKKYLAQMNL